MTAPALIVQEHRWECPNCDFTDVTFEALPHSRFHNCRGLLGMSVGMVPAGTRCKVELNEREDYIGREMVQYGGDGRPYRNAVTTRDDGQDCAVYAPTAHASRKELDL